ncbi:protein-disulfide reductase DsbD domain-containing protein [Jannaschia aquimarina]|uniref:Thiol:disulfide interchange protein DsbD N-terminal domain-containing protein n=1 Tax=Jannaschia aquimarina TaxID=935700 RepID=A0A0D1EMZ7_9RHOB|nr:protein-disulfide reductase DsbD domain-containing protein [Jannaschia aquimarina]KIT17080.1 hypothetical protein jaqu_11220 [Jannaschia aquimarina]SNS46331.1 Thiol-disulfide interchange protein, contains DsbC and DsbD domains [Jannaschia aquimarina]
MIRLLFALFVAISAVHGPSTASAQVPSDTSQVIRIDVRPGWRRDDGAHVAGLAISLAPGWKTYWRSAGSLGISPSFDWRKTRNAASVSPRWPSPRVFEQSGGQAVGYDSDFVLPLVIRTRDRAAPVRLRGRMELGVCADICVPARIDVDATLPAGGAPDPSIQAALDHQPVRRNIGVVCRFEPVDGGMRLTGEVSLPPLGRQEAVVFELPDPTLWVTDAVVARHGERLKAQAKIMGRGPFVLDRREIRITIIGPGRAIEITGCTT